MRDSSGNRPVKERLRGNAFALVLIGVAFLGVIRIAEFSRAQVPGKPPVQNRSKGEIVPLSTGDIDALFAGFMDPYDYDPRGRRDPFVQPIEDKPVSQGALHGPVLPLQRFELSELRLVGIIWDVRKPRAMIRDPKGETHIVGPNAKMGPRNGYIASIREGEIVVVETIDQEGRLISTAQVVKIAK